MADKGKRLAGLAGLTGGFTSKDRGSQSTQGAEESEEDERASETEGDAGKLAAMEELHSAMKDGDHEGMSKAMGDYMDIHMSKKANT
jgi:hypothetical protein